MNPENNQLDYQFATAQIDIEPEFANAIPDNFKRDPFLYFEIHGKNVKSGDIKYDEFGVVREDPTAVKDLPEWVSADGAIIHPVAKKVNVQKGMVGQSSDPFYEYKVMEYVRSKGLPAARPIAKASQGDSHLIVMEKVTGVRWAEKDNLHLNEQGYTAADIEDLVSQANKLMEQLKEMFEQAGVKRGWKLKDMVFDIDIQNKKVISVTPTDWERTVIEEKTS